MANRNDKSESRSTAKNKQDNIDHTLLNRYLTMRRRIAVDTKTIYSLSNILTILNQLDSDTTDIDPHALAHANQLINTAVLNIQEALNDFIPMTTAEENLKQSALIK